MSPGSLSRLLHPVRDAAGRQAGLSTSDAALLARFVARRDEAAFELLVWRHDRLVRGVCRQVLRNEQDVEDAWQATFLTLACKARAISNQQALAGWLYKVAFRIAVRARTNAARRDRTSAGDESLRLVAAPDSLSTHPDDNELRAIVAEEVSRLAERYRAPVVLCYLEGKTNEEAARQLGCPASTIATRLARARERLRMRLARRGLNATAGTLAAILAVTETASPHGLMQSTVTAAVPFAIDKVSAGLVSARVSMLTHEALRTMLMNRMKLFAAVVATLCVVGGGSGLLAYRATAHEPVVPPTELTAAPAPDDPAKEKKPAREVKKSDRHKAEDVITKSFKTSNAPTVTVDVFNGGVTVVADASGAVDAKVTKQAHGDTDEQAKERLKDIDVEITQEKDAIRIAARRAKEKERGIQGSVSAEIRVPAGAVLNLQSDNGSIAVTGGTGMVVVKTANGAIRVKDSKGGLKLTSLNGAIAVTGATGKAELTTSNGEIDLRADRALVTARSANGEVKFAGTLADGSHTFASSNGRVALTLPADAAFHLDAKTVLGGIKYEFGTGELTRGGRAQLKATVGKDPKSTINLETMNGAIEIRRKKE